MSVPMPSPEATAALDEARHARADCEAVLPLAAQLSRRVRAQVQADHFLDLIECVLREAAGFG